MAEEICPIRPIHLRGQLEHLKGNIIPGQRNIVKYGTKQTFLISSQSGINSVDLGGASHIFCFLRSKLGRIRPLFESRLTVRTPLPCFSHANEATSAGDFPFFGFGFYRSGA